MMEANYTLSKTIIVFIMLSATLATSIKIGKLTISFLFTYHLNDFFIAYNVF